MKICFSLANTLFFPLADWLKKKNHQIIIIPATTNKKTLSVFLEAKRKYNFGPFDKNGFWLIEKNISYQKKLEDYLKRENPDLVVSDMVFPSGYLARIIKSLNIPTVSYCFGIDIQYLPEIKYGFKFNERIRKLIKDSIKHFDGFLGSTFALERLKENWKIKSKNLWPIVFPVESPARLKNKAFLKKKWGFKKDDFIVLALCRIHPVKGIEYLIKAIPQVIKKKKICLVIAGFVDKPYYQKELNSLVEKLNLNKYIKFIGAVFGRKKQEIFSLADVFVISSLNDANPKTSLEAINFGSPLITTRVGFYKDFLVDGKNCLLVRKKSPKDIANKIILLASNQKLREKLISEEKKLAKKLSWRKQINIWIKTLEKAAILRKRKVLVFAAHPDDEIIGCGGSILKHVKRGNEVYLVWLTLGGKGERLFHGKPLAKIRKEEAKNVAKFLGVKKIKFLMAKDRQIKDQRKILQAKIIKIIKEFQPDYIYTHHGNDKHKFGDHKATYQIVKNSLRYIKDKNFLKKILAFEVWTPIKKPNYLEDISLYFPEKIKALQKYKSQICSFPYKEMVKRRARKRGKKLGKNKFAEAFKII